MPRSARIAPGGVVFHVLNRGNARSDIFDDAADYAAFEKTLAECLALFPGVQLFAYCLMPNHWHLVLRPRHAGELGRFMQRLTVTHVRRWHEHRHSGGHGHVYQGTYKSFPVQPDDRHFLLLCRYVERNPLRARLVRRAENWRWSSLWRRLHPADPPSPAKTTKPTPTTIATPSVPAPLPPLSAWPVPAPADWLDLVNRLMTAAEIGAMQTSLRRGRPLGDPAWQQRTAARLNLLHSFRPRGRPRKTVQ